MRNDLAPVPIAVAVPASCGLLRFKVALLRSMLRYVSRKLLILKQCYMLRFFENECGSPQGQRKAESAICTSIYSRKALYIILKKT